MSATPTQIIATLATHRETDTERLRRHHLAAAGSNLHNLSTAIERTQRQAKAILDSPDGEVPKGVRPDIIAEKLPQLREQWEVASHRVMVAYCRQALGDLA